MIDFISGAQRTLPARPSGVGRSSEVAASRPVRASRPARLRVAHVVLSMDCGGLERVVLDLVRESTAQHEEVSILCLERAGTLAAQAAAAGVAVTCLDKQPGLRPGLVRQIEAVLRKQRPDVVHTHQIGALLYAGPASRRAGIPLVVHTEHGKHYGGRWKLRLLARIAGRHASRVFCVSEDIAAEVKSMRIVPGPKIRVVPNGIDVIPFGNRDDAGAEVRDALGIPRDAPTIGTVGRLTEIKRQADLIRAFGAVRARCPRAHLLIVGDGPLRAELHGLAVDLGLENCVHFAGYQNQTAAYLKAMDIFTLTSRSEGMPLVVLEAWAAGVPVVATRVGGIPELVRDGSNGLMIDSGDEVALSEALERLIAMPSLARRLADAGQRLVEESYTLRRMAGDYRRNYLEILG